MVMDAVQVQQLARDCQQSLTLANTTRSPIDICLYLFTYLNTAGEPVNGVDK